MFLGCSDNRFTPDKVFDAPIGSFLSHNILANRYSAKDPSAEAALAFAFESEDVQHIIVLGHYGCKGIHTAITMPQSTSSPIRKWIQPIATLYTKSRRQEIVKLRDSRRPHRRLDEGVDDSEGPLLESAGFRALVEENVKQSVSELRKNRIISETFKAARRGQPAKDIFVHGFVYDESTGQVVNLRVSFGTPGRAIPPIPFEAIEAAKNFHRERPRGRIFKPMGGFDVGDSDVRSNACIYCLWMILTVR